MDMSKQAIAELNSKAQELIADGQTVIRALEIAANDAELELIAEEGGVRIYRNADGELVNCWTEGELEDGGAGFDNQTEWYTETE